MHAFWAVMPAIVEQSEGCELAAVCDLCAENLDEVKYPGVAKFTDFRAMIDSTELDALYVCTMSDTHFQMVMAGLEAGLHVVCEKPLANDLAQCRAMIDKSEEVGRRLFVVFENRYHPYNRTIRQWIRDGHLGEVEAIHWHLLWDAHKSFGDLAARRARAAERTGSLDCGIHQLDLTRYFFGGDWGSVQALGAWFGEELTNPPHISLLTRLLDGPIVTMNSSYAYGAYMEPRVRTDGLTIVGMDGVINYCCDEECATELKLTSKDLIETCAHDVVPHNQAIGWLLNDVADVVERGKPAPPELADGHDGLKAQIIVEQALAQARESRRAADGLPAS